MLEDTKSRIGAVGGSRTDGGRIEHPTDAAREQFDRGAEALRQEFERRTDETRLELGDRVFDLAEEYFPETADRRRRQTLSVGFVVGLAIGFVARHLLDR